MDEEIDELDELYAFAMFGIDNSDTMEEFYEWEHEVPC
jgi:hypothetical protein